MGLSEKRERDTMDQQKHNKEVDPVAYHHTLLNKIHDKCQNKYTKYKIKIKDIPFTFKKSHFQLFPLGKIGTQKSKYTSLIAFKLQS